MSAEEVAKAFVQHFYQTFDSNIEGLAGLYVSKTSEIPRSLACSLLQMTFFFECMSGVNLCLYSTTVYVEYIRSLLTLSRTHTYMHTYRVPTPCSHLKEIKWEAWNKS